LAIALSSGLRPPARAPRARARQRSQRAVLSDRHAAQPHSRNRGGAPPATPSQRARRVCGLPTRSLEQVPRPAAPRASSWVHATSRGGRLEGARTPIFRMATADPCAPGSSSSGRRMRNVPRWPIGHVLSTGREQLVRVHASATLRCPRCVRTTRCPPAQRGCPSAITTSPAGPRDTRSRPRRLVGGARVPRCGDPVCKPLDPGAGVSSRRRPRRLCISIRPCRCWRETRPTPLSRGLLRDFSTLSGHEVGRDLDGLGAECLRACKDTRRRSPGRGSAMPRSERGLHPFLSRGMIPRASSRQLLERLRELVAADSRAASPGPGRCRCGSAILAAGARRRASRCCAPS